MQVLCGPTEPTRKGISRNKRGKCHKHRIPKRLARGDTRSNSDDNTAKTRNRHLPHNANAGHTGKNPGNGNASRGTGGNSSRTRVNRRTGMNRRGTGTSGTTTKRTS